MGLVLTALFVKISEIKPILFATVDTKMIIVDRVMRRGCGRMKENRDIY